MTAPSLASAPRVRALQLPQDEAPGALAGCLSGAEARLMATFRHPRRRDEFAAGRLAVKHAVLDAGAPSVRIGAARPPAAARLGAMRRLEVLPDAEGRPALRRFDDAGPRADSLQVSIAHAAGWAAAACAPRPLGIDIVDAEAPAAVDPGTPWLRGVDAAWLPRLQALAWSIRECLLKAGQTEARTVWALEGVHAVPDGPATDLIARWPRVGGLCAFTVQAPGGALAGAFVALSRSTLLTMISSRDPQ